MKFFSQSTSSIKTDDHVKKSFQIIQGNNHSISQIRGMSNNNDPNTYSIRSNFQKYNKDTGIMHSRHKSYRLKSSEILNLFKDSSKYEHSNNSQDIHVKDSKTSKKSVSEPKKKSVIKKPVGKKPVVKKVVSKPKLKKESDKGKTVPKPKPKAKQGTK